MRWVRLCDGWMSPLLAYEAPLMDSGPQKAPASSGAGALRFISTGHRAAAAVTLDQRPLDREYETRCCVSYPMSALR